MATVIQIAHDIDVAAVARVEALLEETTMRNPNWNGASFAIERDDYTCVLDDDSADAIALLSQIHLAIAGDE